LHSPVGSVRTALKRRRSAYGQASKRADAGGWQRKALILEIRCRRAR
jgi:hypothetical protein